MANALLPGTMTVLEIVLVPEPEGICRMRASHKLDRVSVSFDEPNLVANAGLLAPALIA